MIPTSPLPYSSTPPLTDPPPFSLSLAPLLPPPIPSPAIPPPPSLPPPSPLFCKDVWLACSLPVGHQHLVCVQRHSVAQGQDGPTCTTLPQVHVHWGEDHRGGWGRWVGWVGGWGGWVGGAGKVGRAGGWHKDKTRPLVPLYHIGEKITEGGAGKMGRAGGQGGEDGWVGGWGREGGQGRWVAQG